MRQVLIQQALKIQSSPIHGYGVFAASDILAFSVIEECHTLVFYPSRRENNSILNNYFFASDQPGKKILALGNGSIFNHADIANASYEYDAKRQLMIFKANRFIKSGEEIFIDYGSDWFSSRINAYFVERKKRVRNKCLRFVMLVGLILLTPALFMILPSKFF